MTKPKKDEKKDPKAKKPTGETFGELRKRLGIIKASEVRSGHIVRRPTGLPGLDYALAGGAPCGQIIQLAGPDAGGKTSLALQMAAAVQQRKGKNARILWVPIEGKIDKEYARRLGFIVPWSLDEIAALEKGTGKTLTQEEKDELRREVCPVDMLPIGPAEEVLQNILYAVASDEYDLIVLDSISGLVAEEDLVRAVKGKQVEVTVGGERAYAHNINSALSSFAGRFYLTAGKESPKGRPNLTVLVAIHQVRADVSGNSAFGWKVPGSFALKHVKAVDVWVYPGKQLKVGDEVVGRFTHWLIAKAKYGVQTGAKGTVLLRPRTTGFDAVDDLFGTIKENGLAVSSGPNWTLINRNGELVEEYHKISQENLVEKLRCDPAELTKWQRVYEGLFERKPIYEWSELDEC